ncbi:Hypothetical predicted protein [Pelobates cultripes]|uniref:Uncharacterized protein n=1 Tax=Pelobates cultripes TaxID=61616 RepID=A0AAD1VR71_PELCU|nr:Hypothetical predicted protein [Pelobates cultripes]
MSNPKGKKNAQKNEKLNFFTQKNASNSEAERGPYQDGADEQTAGNIPNTGPSYEGQENMTKTYLDEAMNTMADKLIKTWQSSIGQLRKEIQDIGSRTTHVENKLSEYVTGHNDMANHVATLEQKIEIMEAYVQGLLRAYAPDIPTDMLLVDRVHRVPKPRNLPDSILRDVLLRAHYFHIKEAVLRASRNRTELHETYTTVKILADLSTATLKRRRDFHPVKEELRCAGIRYRWGTAG